MGCDGFFYEYHCPACSRSKCVVVLDGDALIPFACCLLLLSDSKHCAMLKTEFYLSYVLFLSP
jgi:hypothetical protein